MTQKLDVFRLEASGVLWLGSAADFECAKARVQELAASSPGEYLVLDQETGDKHIIKLDGVGPSSVTERKPVREEDSHE